ncbi:MAG: ribosome small subunit-dependent GTPase A [Anaerolineaceae bacterium]
MLGRVMRSQSGFFTVLLEDTRVVTCGMRGKLKRGPKSEDLVAMGDQVRVTLLTDNTGVIEEVLKRDRALIRLAPSARGEYKQILLANPDQMLLVFACANPNPHLRMLDRFLVICEKQGIVPVIVANKVDLVGLERAKEMFAMYPPLGYQLIFSSAKGHIGIDALRDVLTGKLSGLAGPSGVGNSSLLNAVQPELGLAVSNNSEFTQKGRHTTVVRELFPLDGGGYVADLPGLRMLALWDTEPEELDGYFPELRDLVRECAFNDCTHQNEPGCAVRQAVQTGKVHPERYLSYLRMRFGEPEEPDEQVSPE